jgi:IMP dehydrogenase
METTLTFNDVLLKPKFSDITSRKDVDLSVKLFGKVFTLPVISAPMDTITGWEMCKAMTAAGGIGMLHRFNTIDQNVEEFIKADKEAICSIGINEYEFQRAQVLVNAGCTILNIDTANGGMQSVVDFFIRLRETLPNTVYLIVGAFATYDVVAEFIKRLPPAIKQPDAIRLNIGGGSVCQTRLVTGAGYPLMSSLLSFRGYPVKNHPPIILDGGLSTSGDAVKALAAGASMVMSGYLFAGTKESLGEPFIQHKDYGLIAYSQLCKIDQKLGSDPLAINQYSITHKNYRGSASQESYDVQGKTASHRAPEGVSTLVPYVGSVTNVLNTLEGGLRSGLSYVGARTIGQLQEKAEFIQVSSAAIQENKPWAKK